VKPFAMTPVFSLADFGVEDIAAAKGDGRHYNLQT